jgi:acetyltransferase
MLCGLGAASPVPGGPDKDERQMRQHRLEALFDPRVIAVVGASERPGSVGARVFANLAGGFKGTVVPVNPKHKTLAGRRCYGALAEVEEDVDLAVVATPARTIAGILRDCGEAGIGATIVLSAGFGETGEGGQAAEAELLATARRHGVRFLGPNCLGLVRPGIGMNATFLEAPPPAGRLAIVSQSGALLAAIADWAGPHHLGFSAMASLGNAADIDFGDMLDYLSADPQTDAILLYVEGVRHARSFMSALRIAARTKPLIVLKAGRHRKGSAAASTHTGALIGSDEVFDAALERAGVVRAQTFGQLFGAAEILAAKKPAGGNRLAIVTNGGGAGVLAADRAGDLGVEVAALSEETVARLDRLLPPYWSHGNPVDILGDAGPEAYREAVAACLADRGIDGALVLLTPQAMTQPEEAARAVRDAARGQRKPVLACWMGETSVARARTVLSEAGIPDFTTPERAVEAFAHLARHNLNQRLALELPAPLSDLPAPDAEGAAMIIEAALAEGREMLSDIESKAVLRAFHIPCAMTIEADSPAKALTAAETLGFPVAMKINSPDITHKSDVGGVRTNIMSAADVRRAFREITEAAAAARPEARILGVTVEAMARDPEARELVVGTKRDAVFGPVILFGAGGIMVEILEDKAVALPPLNEVLASRLINRTRVSRLLDAFRNRPAVDRKAVIEVLLRVSDLVCEVPHVEELDINPLFAGPAGVLAVDARILVRRPPAAPRPYAHMAVTPYPKRLEQTHHLADGSEVVIRPIRPEDAENEQAFVRGLSAQAKRFRFMRALNELTPEMLARFTNIDYDREMALVAVSGEPGKTRQLGVARYVINPDERTAEFAIVVGDEAQNKGIGTRLMKTLMQAAREHGLEVIEGEVLAENAPMLRLVRELGFSARRSPDDAGVYVVERWL